MAKAKTNSAATWAPKPKRKLRRHTKHINKHKSSKSYNRQGR